MSVFGQIAKWTGVLPYIDTYRAGQRAPQREAELKQEIEHLASRVYFLSSGRQTEFLAKPHRHPGIVFNTMPKSGSVFIARTLAASLDVEYSERPIAHGFFPHYYMIDWEAKRIANGNVVRQKPFDVSSLNFMILGRHTDRLILHARDPRQAVLSWFHHTDKLRAQHPDGVNYIVHQEPPAYADWDFEKRLDWHIGTELASVVDWLNGWAAASQDPAAPKILFTRFEGFLEDQESLFRKILEFYGIPESSFKLEPTKKTADNNFRLGRSDEWREVFTAAQIARANEIIGTKLRERFEWGA